MGSSFEQLVFEILARDREGSAAFDRFRRNVDGATGAVDKNSAAVDRNAKSLEKHKQSSTSALGALVGLGVAFAPVTAAAAAAGVGFAAFAGTAVPSVVAITKAIAAPGGLAASWMTLDNRQRVAVQGVQALGDRYEVLAKAMEPQVFQTFNTGLGLANSLLAPTGKLAASAGQGIESFLVQFSAHAGIQQFVTFLAHEAGPALTMLGTDVTNIAHAVFALLESFGGTGLLELKALTGVITVLTTSVTFLSEHAPGLTAVALGIGGIALALSKMGLLSGALRLTGITGIAGQMSGFAAATRGATLAEKGMLATTTALDAVSPFGWVVLATAALGGLAYLITHSNDATKAYVATVERQNQAVGFNTEGYYKAAAALGHYNTANEQAKVTVMNLHTGMVTGTTTIGQMTGATATLTAAQKALVAGGNQQDVFLSELQVKYSLTRTGAIALATAAGVLTDKNGRLAAGFKDSVAKASAYADANVRAQKPTTQLAKDMDDFANKTLTATQRTTALTNALKLFFNPAVTADQDTITLKNDQVALAAALHDSGGKTGLLTQKQRDARGAFDTYILQVAQTATDTFTATGRTGDYRRVIENALPTLERAAGHNRTLWHEIRNLVNTERGLRSESIRIDVTGTGTWKLPGQPGSHIVFATGGRVPGDPALGDVYPALLKGGEAVVPTELVPPLVPYLKAHGVPGFASGGLAGMSPWVNKEFAATLAWDENRVAKALAAALNAVMSGGGGGLGGNAQANRALGRAMMLGMWGPGQWNALDALWTRESGWNNMAYNAASGATGIPQALPYSKMPRAAWLPFQGGQANAGAQIGWGLGYISGRYGTPGVAWGHELSSGWYDRGGYLPPGLSLALNTTGAPERVGGGNTYNITVNMPFGSTRAEVLNGLTRALDDLHRTGRLP